MLVQLTMLTFRDGTLRLQEFFFLLQLIDTFAYGFAAFQEW